MKVIGLFLATLSLAAAFAPQQTTLRTSTELNSLFDDIANLDIFNYGGDAYNARKKKGLKQGKLGKNSYVPAGLTKAQYQKVRAADKKKADSNYSRNVSKAGKYLGYDEFYLKRGTDLNGKWKKSVTLGHRMAKTKYDFSGEKDEVKSFESFFKG